MSDAPASLSTTFSARVGGSNRAFISTSTDRDWFRISLDPRFSYSFRVASSGSLDPVINVQNNRGLSLAFNDDASTSTRDSLINFRPDAAGVYFLDVGSYRSLSTGEYTLSVSASPTAPTQSSSRVVPPSRVTLRPPAQPPVGSWDRILGPGFQGGAISDRRNQMNGSLSSNLDSYQGIFNGLGRVVRRGETNGHSNFVISNPTLHGW
jgi:hypothetical protein